MSRSMRRAGVRWTSLGAMVIRGPHWTRKARPCISHAHGEPSTLPRPQIGLSTGARGGCSHAHGEPSTLPRPQVGLSTGARGGCSVAEGTAAGYTPGPVLQEARPPSCGTFHRTGMFDVCSQPCFLSAEQVGRSEQRLVKHDYSH